MTYFDGQFFVEAAVTMFVIMDPPGVVPLFLAYTRGFRTEERRRVAWQAAATAFSVIVSFALFGTALLDYLHVEVPAMQIAGGLLLLLVSLDLLTGRTRAPEGPDTRVNVALVPLGTPLLAGPGAIVATIVFVEQARGQVGRILALATAIVGVHLALWLCLRFSEAIIRVVKENGVELIMRIAGLLLAAIAVQLVVDAIRTLLEAGG